MVERQPVEEHVHMEPVARMIEHHAGPLRLDEDHLIGPVPETAREQLLNPFRICPVRREVKIGVDAPQRRLQVAVAGATHVEGQSAEKPQADVPVRAAVRTSASARSNRSRSPAA